MRLGGGGGGGEGRRKEGKRCGVCGRGLCAQGPSSLIFKHTGLEVHPV